LPAGFHTELAVANPAVNKTATKHITITLLIFSASINKY
jgi:hypothetical protein